MDLTGIGSVADLAKGLIDRFFPPDVTPEQRAKVQIEVEKMLQQDRNVLLDAQKSIIVAEMQQTDTYTKRARPTIVYAGLGYIFLVHVFMPLVAFFTSKALPTVVLPSEFWWAWSGVCGIWIVGRSAEKKGVENKLVSMITGKG